MFNKKNPTGIDLVIKIANDELLKLSPTDPDYVRTVEMLERLNKIKTTNRRDPVSYDGLVALLGNVLVTGMIIHHERLNVITTKAISFIRPLR